MYTKMKCLFLQLFGLLVVFASCEVGNKNTTNITKYHKVEINHRVLVPEEGLLIGNGDLSVSIYQNSNSIIWRFGKNDVWDRRHDTKIDPEPAHIEEIAKGINEEGWVNNSFNQGIVKKKEGRPVTKRAQEICDGTPSYAFRPYPCPKPIGELAFNLPMDQKLLSISQVLTIEQAIINVNILFESGVSIHLECFIPPEPDVLVVNWKVENWNNVSATGFDPCSFSLYRWADPSIAEFAKKWLANTGSDMFMRFADPNLSPLPPPETGKINSTPVISQRFYPDFDSTQGFRCFMLPVAPDCKIKIVNPEWKTEARLQISPKKKALSGSVAVGVVTGNFSEEVDKKCQDILTRFTGEYSKTIQALRQTTIKAGSDFWKLSEVATDDSLFNRVWYETLHAKRCTYRQDVIAPGLYLPSTLNDYSPWHGDYHTNYNYQSAFWGRYEANHLGLGNAFFPGMKYMVDLGRRLARDYWNGRGTFIQLVGYPFTIKEDPMGVGSLCRMAYMTGWISNHYWYRYLYTMDKLWLKEEGYPVIRDVALFYMDFLKKGDDGKYHAFPSGQNEYHFTGKTEDYTDKPQVIRHARYALQIAANASKVLDTDRILNQQWNEIVNNIIEVDSLDVLGYTKDEKHKYFANSPEFFTKRQIIEPSNSNVMPDFLKQAQDNSLWSWYFGFMPMVLTGNIRNGNFDADRDYPTLREFLNRWRMPNGLFRSMSQNSYGYMGAMSECLGILGPLNEMLIQSWNDGIHVFPAWPKSIDASFKTLRTRGAFLVSSQLKGGEVQYIKITSEKGGDCIVVNPWNDETLSVIRNGEKSMLNVDKKITLKTSTNDVILIMP